MRREEVVAWFKVLYWYSPGGTQENNEKLSHDSRSPGRYLNPALSEHEAGVLTIWPQCSVWEVKVRLMLLRRQTFETERLREVFQTVVYEPPVVRRRFRKKKLRKNCIRHLTNVKYAHTCLYSPPKLFLLWRSGGACVVKLPWELCRR
jgi:hypothetical protein